MLLYSLALPLRQHLPEQQVILNLSTQSSSRLCHTIMIQVLPYDRHPAFAIQSSSRFCHATHTILVLPYNQQTSLCGVTVLRYHKSHVVVSVCRILAKMVSDLSGPLKHKEVMSAFPRMRTTSVLAKFAAASDHTSDAGAVRATRSCNTTA